MAKRTKDENQAVDYLMWVGSFYYPTADVYIKEARDRGPCKRLGKIPHELLDAVNDPEKQVRIFLAHDEGVEGEGFIFGYFEPTAIEYLYTDMDQIPDKLVQHVVAVDLLSLEEDDRECGQRDVGPYVVGLLVNNLQKLETEPIVVFDRPRTLEAFDPDRKHFRGMLRIEYGEKVVKAKKSQTTVPPSLNAAEPIARNEPWTEEEDALVLERLDGVENLSREAQILEYEIGRQKSSVIYRYQKLTSEDE